MQSILNTLNVEEIINIILDAGKISQHYFLLQDNDLEIKYKDHDQQAVTIADHLVQDLICEKLSAISSFVIIAEEKSTEQNRVLLEKQSIFWLLDPIDGTDSFIEKKNYTINLALIYNSRPIFGIIYAPVKKECYFTRYDSKTQTIQSYVHYYKLENTQHSIIKTKRLCFNQDQSPNQEQASIITNSRSRKHKLFPQYINSLTQFSSPHFENHSSAYKFCEFLQNNHDALITMCAMMEWDIASGEILILGAGGQVYTHQYEPTQYGKDSLKAEHIIALPHAHTNH